MIVFGASDMTKAYVGSTEVSKAYLGDELVWGGSSPVLPYDAEVEYLESTGSQYIDTGVVLNSSSSNDFHFKYAITSLYSSADIQLLGAVTASSNSTRAYQFITNANTIRTRWCNSTNYTSSAIALNDVIEFYCNGGKWVLKNITKNQQISYSGGTSYPRCSIALFGRNVDGIITGGKCRFYSARISDAVDMIPVRIGTVGYMYDKVSGELFGNSGTGSFTLGPDVI